MAEAAANSVQKAPDCSGKNEHAFCAHLLANLIPRQLLDKQYMHDIMNEVTRLDEMTVENLSTGSRAELLYVPTFCNKKNVELRYISDFDAMKYAGFITKDLHIQRLPETYNTAEFTRVQFRDRFRTADIVLVTSEDVRPGFCFVCSTTVNKRSTSQGIGQLLFFTHECLASTDTEPLDGAATTHHILGEADQLHDDVPCFVCDFWPDQARSVFERQHNLWPTKALLQACEATCRLLIVRKAHPLSKNPDVEFRFSFSLLEIALSRSLPDEVRYVYLTVKLLCKVTPLADTPLKTYYLKTILYWIASREDISAWQYSNFRQSVVFFFAEVTRAFRDKNIPNFFVPESNLIEHLSDDDCTTVAGLIDTILENMCNVVLTATASLAFLQDYYDERKPYVSYDRAKALFRRHTMLTSAVAPNEVRFEFERSLGDSPTMINCLVEYGEFMWNAGHHACSFVSWLNVLLIFFTDAPGKSVPKACAFVLYTNDDRTRFDSLLRLLFNESAGGNLLVCQTQVLALFYLVTKHGISQQSAEHLIALIEPSASKKFFDETFDGRHDSLVPMSDFMLKYCRYHCAFGNQVPLRVTEATLQYTVLRRMRENVYNVCQAVCEYVSHYSCLGHVTTANRAKRRHSFSGTNVVSRLSKEQDWKTRIQVFTRNFGVNAENRVNPKDVLDASNRRLKITANLVKLVDEVMGGGDDPEKRMMSMFMSVGLAQLDDESEFLIHTLEEIYSLESQETQKIRMFNFIQAGMARAQLSSTGQE